MARVLILACGNPLRGDDGVAWHVAEELQRTLPSHPGEIRCLHQFTPELAEAASHVRAVIFLDATTKGTPGQVVCEPVDAEAADSRFSHHLEPASVIALARQLYGASPQAFVVTVCGECFDHREGLSEIVAAAIPKMVRTTEELWEQMLTSPSLAAAKG